jgi:AcrR family transcriptional regulator
MTSAQRRDGVRGNGTRRDELLSIAANVFARQGVANATVRDIAEAAGILSGSLYHHFDSKDEMVREILEPVLEQLVRDYDAAIDNVDSVPEALRALLRVGFHFVSEHRNEATILQNDVAYLRDRFSFVASLDERVGQRWIAALTRGVERGELRADLDLKLVYRMMMGSVQSAVRWLRPRGRYSADEVASQYADAYLGGLLRSN